MAEKKRHITYSVCNTSIFKPEQPQDNGGEGGKQHPLHQVRGLLKYSKITSMKKDKQKRRKNKHYLHHQCLA